MFLNFLLLFGNLDSISNIFKKKIFLIADVFLNWRTPKNVVRQMSKKSRLRGPFYNQHGKQAETLLKSERQHLNHIYWSLWRQLSWKKSLLVNGPKHCWKLNDITFTIIIDHCEDKSVRNGVCQW